MYEYASRFELHVERDELLCPYDVTEIKFISENPELWDMIDFDAEFYFDHPEIEKLNDGLYTIYVRGVAEFESDRDWESGIEEGNFLLGVDKISISPVESDKEAENDL